MKEKSWWTKKSKKRKHRRNAERRQYSKGLKKDSGIAEWRFGDTEIGGGGRREKWEITEVEWDETSSRGVKTGANVQVVWPCSMRQWRVQGRRMRGRVGEGFQAEEPTGDKVGGARSDRTAR